LGVGLPTISLSGHTGWGAGTRPDGFQEFQDLYETVFAGWHDARQERSNGTNPDDIKLIFADELDDFTWAVAPQSFVLKRNKSRPLLSTYQISMIKLETASLKSKWILRLLAGADYFGYRLAGFFALGNQ
jgi:hypothetical protein